MSGRDKSWTTASGKDITETDANRLAKEFEQDDAALDTGTVTFPRRAGRPSLTGRAAVSPRVSFRVAPELRDQAERLAGEQGATVSRLAREALEQLVHSRMAGGDLDQVLMDHLIDLGQELLEGAVRVLAWEPPDHLEPLLCLRNRAGSHPPLPAIPGVLRSRNGFHGLT